MYYCIHLSYIYTVFIAHEGFPPLSSSLHVEEKHFFFTEDKRVGIPTKGVLCEQGSRPFHQF